MNKIKIGNIFNVSLGNFFEMYDFMVFGLFATYIAKSFFPNSSTHLSLMLSFMTFGVGFLMRPVGAIVLGAYIDRHGRKKGLLVTLSLMAIGTLTIAITPSYHSIGVAAPIIVLIGRLIQGFSAGAELGGVSIYLAEIASDRNRGFIVSFQSASQQLAVVTSAAFGYVLNYYFVERFMENFGWRIPFIFGCIILPVILFQRMKLEETHVFLNSKTIHPNFKSILIASSKNFVLVILCSLMVMLTTVSFYTITAYTPTFVRIELNLTHKAAFLLTCIIGLSNFVLLPIMGALSDKIGRYRQLLIFSLLFIITAYPVMLWLTQDIIYYKIVLGELWFSLLYTGYNGAMVASLTEIIPPNIRAINFSFSYSIATALYGGFTPAIVTELIHLTHNKAMPGAYLTVAAICSICAIKILHKKHYFKLIN